MKNYCGIRQTVPKKSHIIYAEGLFMLVMAFISMLFVVLGILIKYFRWYWLISGYNTMPAEKKKNVDARGLGNFIGNCMFVIAGIFLAGIIVDSMGFHGGNGVRLIMSVFVSYILVRHKSTTITKRQKTDKAVLQWSITAVVIILAPGRRMIFETRPVKVEITTNIEHKGDVRVNTEVSSMKTSPWKKDAQSAGQN